MAVVPTVAFGNGSPLTAAVRLPNEQSPSHTRQLGEDRGAQIGAQRTGSLTVGHEIWGAG
jgi:hypothetical protein